MFFQAEAAKQPAGPVVRWGGQARDLGQHVLELVEGLIVRDLLLVLRRRDVLQGQIRGRAHTVASAAIPRPTMLLT